MDATELAGHRLWQLRRARRGAALSRRRVLDALEAAPVITQSLLGPVRDLTGTNAWTLEHDLSYYAGEVVKILSLAGKVRGDHRVQAALDVVEEQAPELKAFRNAVTHPEDNRTADDVLFVGAAMRLRPGMQAEYVIDPRSGLHDAFEDLVAAWGKGLSLNNLLGRGDAGSPVFRRRRRNARGFSEVRRANRRLLLAHVARTVPKGGTATPHRAWPERSVKAIAVGSDLAKPPPRPPRG